MIQEQSIEVYHFTTTRSKLSQLCEAHVKLTASTVHLEIYKIK